MKLSQHWLKWKRAMWEKIYFFNCQICYVFSDIENYFLFFFPPQKNFIEMIYDFVIIKSLLCENERKFFGGILELWWLLIGKDLATLIYLCKFYLKIIFFGFLG